MVAVLERITQKPSRRARCFGEHRRSPRFEPSADTGPTDPCAVPRGVDALVPTVTSNATPKPRPRSKQPTPRSDSCSARQTRAAELQIATDCVVAELARIAFADIRELFDEHDEIVPLADLPPGICSAIAEYRVHHGKNGTHTVSVRLHSKLPALVALGRHLGMFDPRADRVAPAELLPNEHERGGR